MSRFFNTTWPIQSNNVEKKDPVPSDLEIARSVRGQPISDLCKSIGLEKFEPYGTYKAKVTCPVPPITSEFGHGGYVVVTGITPTSLGEGKSTTTIGLAQALMYQLKKNTIACIRQPSQGPTFGLKGGAAGGGYSQVWPMDEFNLHLTGDIHAVTAANNLIAAAIDARMFHESTQNDEDLFRRLVDKPGCKGKLTFTDAQKRRLKKLGIPENLEPDQLDADQKRRFARLDIDPSTITLNRVIDTNDRFLRQITIGQSATEKNQTRVTKFTISVASELMAILSLASDLEDVCRRVDRMVLGFTKISEMNPRPKPVTCDDLCVSGAVVALLKDAIYPTIIQTLEGSPVLVHCGPFANVAHGNSSVIADKIALKLAGIDGYVVTEAGFASDIGFEKFMDIKCRASKLMPDCAVLVVTIKALKVHGRYLKNDASDEEAVELGLANMNAHIKNVVENFRVPVIVALNRFTDDKPAELEIVQQKALKAGATSCCVAENWAKGGEGAALLAEKVDALTYASRTSMRKAKFLYPDEGISLIDKINTVATKVYGAADVSIPESVKNKIALLEENGFGSLPVCIAKTSTSISHDAKLKGVPTNYTFPIISVEVSAGAGFVYALAGEISTMPGLPTRPAFFDIFLDTHTGLVEGLF